MMKRPIAAALAAFLLLLAALPAAAAAIFNPDDGVIRADDMLAGNGIVIAVIDDSFDLGHASLTLPEGADVSFTRETLIERLGDTYAARQDCVQSVDDCYSSEKVPFFFDYYDNDVDVYAPSGHGMHVAASAAGYDSDAGVCGAAPAAQLLLMKVFSDDGTLPDDALYHALCDAITLGADVISLSLGGPSYSSEIVFPSHMMEAYQRAVDSGILVVCAASNDGTTGYCGADSSRQRLSNPDYGTIGEPAALTRMFSVGALTNPIKSYMCLTLGDGTNIQFTHADGPDIAEVFDGRTLPYAAVPGFGEDADYEGIDVTDAVALISRGEITFQEKIVTAWEHGAVAAVISNSVPGDQFFGMSVSDIPIPAIGITMESGELMREAEDKRLAVSAEPQAFFFDIEPTDFTSWGVTSDMKLAPLISAIGEDVYSAGMNGDYVLKDGTSMAAPQISGVAAAILSYDPPILRGTKGAQKVLLLQACMMSSAVPVCDGYGVPYSPRAQGSGFVRTELADALLRAADEGLYVALGDKIDGAFTFTVSVMNLAEEERTFSLRTVIATDDFDFDEYGIAHTLLTPLEIPAEYAYEGGDRVTLAPGESTEVTVTVTPDADALEILSECYENGFYIDGFFFADDGDCEASIPLLGFFGDWNSAPLFDEGEWDGANGYYGVQSVIKGAGDYYGLAGYTEAGCFSSLFAFAPDFDGWAEELWLQYPLLRCARVLEWTVYDAEGNAVYDEIWTDAIKSFANNTVDLWYYSNILWDGSDPYNESYIFPDGEYTVVLSAVSYTGAEDELVIPVRIDTVKPTISASYEDGILTVRAEDDFALCSLCAYTTDGSGVEEFAEVPDAEHADALEISAAVDDGVPYVYLRAEDQAGNVTLLRWYPQP